ncbi:MAG TPA: hypothetical protein VN791_05550 [Acidimicrobiales bacterium]|nr:hypothetical protein [Acidimicrobiales bacterium]
MALALALAGASTAVALRDQGERVPPAPTHPGSLLPSVTVPTAPPTATSTVPPVPVGTTLAPPPAPTSGPLVTPQVEQEVVATTWQAFATAFAEDDVADIEATSTPSVQQMVTGWFSCGCTPWPVASTQVSYSAPPQTSYPLSFMAELDGTLYDGTPLDKQAVFTQAAPTAPWLVAYVGSYTGGEPVLGTWGTSLQAAAPPVPSDITAAPQELADFFQVVDQAGMVPALPPGFVDDTYLKQTVSQAQQDVDNRAQLHQEVTLTHTIEQISPVFASTGGDVVCADMTLSSVTTSARGGSLVQSPDYHPWGHLLAPGSYPAVTDLERYDVCFFEDESGTIQLFSDMGGPYSLSGR